MKNFTWLLAIFAMAFVPACYKGDIKDLQKDVEEIRQQLKTYETLLNALNNRLYVSGYTTKNGSYEIKFSDGSSIDVRNTSAFITIGENGNWYIDGEDTGQPSAGQAPEIKIGANGNWFIAGEDSGISAAGQPGADAPTIVSIAVVNGVMTFTFSNGQTISLQTQTPQVSITIPSGGFRINKWKWLLITPDVKYADEAEFAWVIGEDTISTSKNLHHVFAAPGSYSLKLVAKNGVGSDEQQVQVEVADETYTNGVFKVFEYLPAPGQHINKLPAYITGETPAQMAKKAEDALKANGMVGLGGYGGYIVMGFDHVILNSADKRDFLVKGNAFANSSEPGIIMVSSDLNGNGLPDDEWYEIAGSEYHKEATIKNYEITYHKPNPLNGDVRWTDNKGGEGYVLRNQYHVQESYFPLWHESNTLSFKGTLLAKTAQNTATPPAQFWVLPAYPWGYADNQANASEDAKIDLEWAVDKDGKPVKVKGIDFIKVYTGVNQDAGWLGETSTEVTGVEDYN